MRVRNCGILLLCIAVLLGTAACSGNKVAPNGMTGADILEMSQTASVNTYQCDDITISNFMGEITTESTHAVVDVTNEELYMLFTSSDPEYGTFSMYIKGDWAYMETEGDWYKIYLTDEIWEQELNTITQWDLLQDFIEVKYVSNEIVNGVECYKLEIQPDLQALFNAIMGEDTGFEIDFEEVIKDFSLFTWVSTDNFYQMKQTTYMTIDMDLSFMQMSGDINSTMDFTHYNEPVDIQLPAGAKNAEVVEY